MSNMSWASLILSRCSSLLPLFSPFFLSSSSLFLFSSLSLFSFLSNSSLIIFSLLSFQFLRFLVLLLSTILLLSFSFSFLPSFFPFPPFSFPLFSLPSLPQFLFPCISFPLSFHCLLDPFFSFIPLFPPPLLFLFNPSFYLFLCFLSQVSFPRFPLLATDVP